MIARLVLLALGPIFAFPAVAETYRSEQADFRLVELADDLESPWGMAFLPDGGILITEQAGQLRLYRGGDLSDPIPGTPDVEERGQGGLLDVAVDPDYAETGWIYLSLSARGEGGLGTQVWRGRIQDNRWIESELLFDMQRKTRIGRHFGSRFAFDPDGRLYFSIGDRGAMQRAQDPADEAGRIHRIERDGTVPSDNPYLDESGTPPTALTRGNRNAQGMATHPDTGVIWTHEHGPRGGDEVNVIRAGANYGWPEVTHGIDYSGAVISDRQSAPGFDDPVHVWVPSIAPSGMAFYSGAAFPEWQGDLFVGALRSRLLVRLELEGEQVIGEEWLLEREVGRIRDVRVGPDGFVYLLTESNDGRLLRLEPVS
ncbi:PQQ-dependent sugar dehydrogenase [Algihabitans albus]|uniref:PQQ-dependent sugar dehydrogenase n=1 Tax=Algihabitans albus TaxID=2164067 RepID=UPI000E5C6700|nr:PQQ-dependent sugar dehydrogenase [Algihabitans albus]